MAEKDPLQYVLDAIPRQRKAIQELDRTRPVVLEGVPASRDYLAGYLAAMAGFEKSAGIVREHFAKRKQSLETKLQQVLKEFAERDVCTCPDAPEEGEENPCLYCRILEAAGIK